MQSVTSRFHRLNVAHRHGEVAEPFVQRAAQVRVTGEMVASKDFFNHSMKRHYENVKLLLISITIIRASTLQQREACRISNSGELHLGRVEDAACGVCVDNGGRSAEHNSCVNGCFLKLLYMLLLATFALSY